MPSTSRRRATERGRRRPHAWQLYLAAGAAAGVAYFTVPGLAGSGPFFNVIGLSAAAMLVLGARRCRPSTALAWYLFAAAQVAFVAGDVAYYTFDASFPSFGDGFYLAVYPLLIAGLLLIIRRRNPGGDRASLIDATMIAIGLGVLSWEFLIEPYATDGGLGMVERVMSMAYPVMDVLLLAVAARLAIAAGSRQPAFKLLTLGFVVLLGTDALYGITELHGSYEPGSWVDAGWLAYYVLLGAAALHPTMRALSDPAPPQPARLSRGRLALLSLTALAAPALEATQGIRTGGHPLPVVAVASGVVFLLVLARMAGLLTTLAEAVASQRRVVERERVLRRAAESLVTATDRRSIHDVILAAGRSLVGDAGAGLRVVIDPGLGEPLRLPGAVRRRLADARSVTCDAAEDAVALAACGLGGLAGDVLVVPLRVRGRVVGVVGAELAAASAGPGELRDPLETLGAEASLALEAVDLLGDLLQRETEERFGALVQASSDVIAILDPDLTVRYHTPSLRSVLGGGTAAVVGSRLTDLLHPDDAVHASAVLGTIPGAGVTPPQEWRLRRVDGGWAHVEVVANNLVDDPRVAGIVVTARDIGERKAFQDELRHQAFHDHLTGLANRALFADRVGHALEARLPENADVSVLFLDVDDFKTVNDSLGHASGDALLVEVAERLRGVLRPADTPARLGGDEFGVLLAGPTSEAQASEVAVRILDALAEPMSLHGKEVRISASIGIATRATSECAETLLRNADVAMYTAKSRGKGRYEVFERGMHEQVLSRLELKGDLERAVARDEFAVVYQPIFRLRSRKLSGFEALVRWNHPTRGVVAPVDFIPLAEETGLVVAIGRGVLVEACRQAQAWTDLGDGAPCTMSVNVSAVQLQDPGLLDDVADALRASGLAPSRLVLEITESVVVHPDTVTRLRELKELGVQLAIDDFGTGYSSLSYLNRLPIDTLKIDRSFVQRLSDEEDSALTRAVVRLGHTLHLQTVAEGVEDPAQAAILRRLGCDLVQGFHFGRPMAAAQVEELLAGARSRERSSGARADVVPDRSAVAS